MKPLVNELLLFLEEHVKAHCGMAYKVEKAGGLFRGEKRWERDP